MRRRLNLLLTLLFLFLVLLCGTGAFFTDQQQARLRAGAASMGLSVSEPEYGTLPTAVEKDSTLCIRFQLRNESSVPVYLSEQVKLYVNGTEEHTKLQLQRTDTGDSSASKDTRLRFEAGEQKVLSYLLSFPGVDALPEGLLAVKGELLFQAATSADGRSGFTYGPVTGRVDLTKGELKIPARSREILLAEVVEAGSHSYEEVRWYRASDTDSTSTLGTTRIWSAFDATKALTLQRDVPQYVRYELVATGGIVRSPVYVILLTSGEIQAKSYDYFNGKEVQADISISKEAT